jgi:DNA-binding HxlR family transcriptional regulator
VLTDNGGELRPVLKALFEWGRKNTAAPNIAP